MRKLLFLIPVLLVLTGNNLDANTSGFRVVGYIPNWIDVSSFALSFDYTQVTHLNFAFQNPDAAGNLIESNTGLATLVAKAHTNNVKVLVSLGGGGAASGTTMANYFSLITTSANRAAFIHKIAVYLRQYKLDGIDVDEEGPAINSNYGPFIKQLTDSLRPAGYLVTAAVGWGGGSIPNATLKLFDWISLMAYDYTGSWDQTSPGQHSPYWFAQSMITEYLGRGVDRDHITLGVPFYGYGFYNNPGDFTYRQIITQYPAAYEQDKVGDTIYYNGTITIWKKTKLALSKVSGIMIWELSQDMSGSKSLLHVISATVDSVGAYGVDLIADASQVKLYPNPTTDNIYIENANPGGKSALIQIVDMSGRELIRRKTEQSGKETEILDISALEAGSYICRISTTEGSFSRILIKE